MDINIEKRKEEASRMKDLLLYNFQKYGVRSPKLGFLKTRDE